MRTLRRLVLALLTLLGAAPSLAQAPGVPDPAAIAAAVAQSRLEPERAVALKNVKLNAGLATLQLTDGLLIPASAIDGKTVEVVFLGNGRITLEPPDEIEAGQLEMYTGSPRLDEEFDEMTLVLGLEAATDQMLKRAKASLPADTARRAEQVFRAWREGPERRLLGVETAILFDLVGDSQYQGYFAARLHGKELGDFLYLSEPPAQEQVTLGRFEPLEATDKEKRKLLRELAREQRRGRLLGLELEDLGQFDNWVSGSLRDREGSPFAGSSSFEPTRYTVDLTLGERDLRLTGRASLELKPAARAPRGVTLKLANDLEVTRVSGGIGGANDELFFRRTGDELAVVLPRPVDKDETVVLTVDYGGVLLDKVEGSWALRDTLFWHPHTGTVDRAPYEVTFHWPKRLDLMACGKRVDGGEQPGGQLWERRTLDLPAAGFSFEVGKFRSETARAGHVEVRVAFDPIAWTIDRDVRAEIVQAVTDSLGYFEEIYGPYPLDELTVVTVPRGYSQATVGLVTLSDAMMLDLGFWGLFLGLEDRRTVIAHEIAHQWWGHLVGWASYRDQWISEAMANYSALLYARHKLGWRAGEHLGPTSGWQSSLLDTLADGRVIESVGPVVLGARLFSSRAGDAYQPIVYKKGAVILDMLARSLGEENFPKIVAQIVKVAAFKPVSTEDFFTLIERITSTDLTPFARQYVYGTGLPEVYYSYRFEPAGPGNPGKWVVRGQAEQQAPYRYRYRVVKTDRGLDAARERLDQIQVADSMLVVPVEIAVYDPARDDPKAAKKKGAKRANALVKGHIQLAGEKTDFAIDVEHDPESFWLDRNAEVFGRFFDESRHPKRMLFYRGLDAAAAGQAEAAQGFFVQALAAEVEVAPDTESPPDGVDHRRQARLLDGAVELNLARLHLDQGRDGEARAAFDRAKKLLAGLGSTLDGELKFIESRLDIRQGNFEAAFRRLHKGLVRRGTLDGTEGYVLLAIAARATGRSAEEKEAVKVAIENGADLGALTGGD